MSGARVIEVSRACSLHHLRAAKVRGVAMLRIALICVLSLQPSSSMGQPFMFQCEDAILSEAQSPDGRFVAAVATRDCGATTPHNRLVTIRLSKDAYAFDTNQIVLAVNEDVDITAEWVAPRELLLRYPPVEVLTVVEQWQGVVIRHEKSWATPKKPAHH